MTDRLQRLVDSVRAAYGSLETPNYAFMEKRYKALLQDPFISDIIGQYFVKDETDLNNHAALHLHVLHDSGSMVVCLSFIARWAMLFRLEAGSALYAAVIDPESAVLPPEKEMVRLLERHRFELLTKAEAAVPLAMNLFDTDPGDVRIYHAVISDDGVVPSVLLH